MSRQGMMTAAQVHQILDLVFSAGPLDPGRRDVFRDKVLASIPMSYATDASVPFVERGIAKIYAKKLVDALGVAAAKKAANII
jgi:hypothetical protein